MVIRADRILDKSVESIFGMALKSREVIIRFDTAAEARGYHETIARVREFYRRRGGAGFNDLMIGLREKEIIISSKANFQEMLVRLKGPQGVDWRGE